MNRTVLAIGLPKTGKTTFLAAFWDVVSSGEVVGSLRLARTAGDMQYLNEIREAWADCKPISRTGPASDTQVTMLLEDSASSTITSLAWTDMLGESFERQWTERVWTHAYKLLVDDAVGALLFVNPAKVTEAPLIVDAQKALAKVRPPPGAASIASAVPTAPAASPKPAPYNPRIVATQVQLVDLLQFVDSKRSSAGPLRLALVVSAWDRVLKQMKTDPQAWLAEAMPLLQQYLTANDDRFEPRAFGVSAQGGDYDRDVEKLREAHQASNRIQVVDGTVSSHDITIPLRWALGGPSVPLKG